jgi:hypothetical protein
MGVRFRFGYRDVLVEKAFLPQRRDHGTLAKLDAIVIVSRSLAGEEYQGNRSKRGD